MIPLIIVFFGCTKEVTPPDLRNIENKIVVNGFISPELEQISVQVSLANKAFGFVRDGEFSEADLISTARMKINNGSQEGTFLYDVEERFYALSTDVFPVEEGMTYHLIVETDQGTVRSTVTIHKTISEIVSYDLDEEGVLEIKWMDIRGEDNYYRMGGEWRGQSGLDSFFGGDIFYDDDFWVSDINRDGQRLSASGEIDPVFERLENVSIDVSITLIDKDFFDYSNILDDHVEDDPFSEFPRLPSNIEGGLGFFAPLRIEAFTLNYRNGNLIMEN